MHATLHTRLGILKIEPLLVLVAASFKISEAVMSVGGVI